MIFLQKGTLRCKLSLQAVIARHWLEMLPDRGYKQLPCPFNITPNQDQETADLWQTVQFFQDYDLGEVDGMRFGKWRFCFTVVGTALPCGIYSPSNTLMAIVDRKRHSDNDGSIDTEVEVVANYLEEIREFCLDLRRGKVQPNEGDSWQETT